MARVKKSRTTKTTKIEDTQIDPLTDNIETTLMEEPVNEEMDVIIEEETDMLAEEESPVPVEEETPAPVEEESPAPVEEESPAPVEDNCEDIVREVPVDNIPLSANDNNIQFEIVKPIVPSIIFIVPYRDRQKQYEFFAKHMKMVLEDYDESSYKILYIHQQDNREFNRGAIKNIGFITVKNMYPDDYSDITLVLMMWILCLILKTF